MPHIKVPASLFCKGRTGFFFGVFSDRLPSQLKKLSAPKTSSKLTFCINPGPFNTIGKALLSPGKPVGLTYCLGLGRGVATHTINIDDSWHKA